MAYELCKRCSKMFEKNGESYCEDCLEMTEREQDLIVDYVRKHPDATILDIITETGVTLKSINTLVEDGHVAFVDNKLKKIDEDKLSKAIDKIVDRKSKFHIRKN